MYYVRNTLLRNHWQWCANRRVRSCHQELTSLKFIAGALVTGRLRTENLTAKLVKFLFGIQRPLTFVMLKLRCGTVRDGEQIRPFAKFYLTIKIPFLIVIFLGFVFLAALAPGR